eukprot:1882587-Amphidinium_carterae.9
MVSALLARWRAVNVVFPPTATEHTRQDCRHACGATHTRTHVALLLLKHSAENMLAASNLQMQFCLCRECDLVLPRVEVPSFLARNSGTVISWMCHFCDFI